MLNIMPNKNEIGAEIICDIKNITNKDLKKIKFALRRYGMLFFRKQTLTSKLYLKFAKNFGKLANYPRLRGLSKISALYFFFSISISIGLFFSEFISSSIFI